MSNSFRIILTGAPAAGKGTISKLIIKTFDFVHISPGDILRQNIRSNTKLGKEAKKFIDEGKLVPDKVVSDILKKRLLELKQKSIILDGYPRTLKQAETLKEWICVDAVLNLIVPHEEIIRRAKNRWIHLPSGRVYNIGFSEPKVPGKDDVTGEDLVQRDDDKPEVLKKRLQIYDKIMNPVLNFYAKQKLLTHFEPKCDETMWQKVEKFMMKLVCGKD
ncbi:GTP:AMP phosphotransferase AK3, mitochondrial-like [Teleopsis dalmanni]|uniref:GTP:AMP phosphotransferase AK3, mitochondrial-like n=1 Tax=Teleopsis dalmanni TaxID=139649 RepID=UPI0018CEA5D6|nr:GTP:AMP phosphotransferase AK3, mitochondrial-like [Teleopsis dalmanni]